MSDTKISALTALAGADADVATDLLPIVDISAASVGSKKITLAEFQQIPDSRKDPHYMGVFVSSAASTTISGISDGVSTNFVKMAGTTTITNQSATMDDDTGTSNRIRYTGTTVRHFHIVCQMSISPDSGANQKLIAAVFLFDDSLGSGALLAHSVAKMTASSSGSNVVQITTHADAMLDTNDYLEIWLANETSTNNATAENAYLFATAMNKEI